MTVYFKAVRPDGASFHDPSVSYVTKAGTPRKLVRPIRYDGFPRICGPGMLHCSDAPAETLVGGSWPCRLFEVEGVGPVLGQLGHKFGFGGLRVVHELPAWQALGPNGEAVAALIERAGWLTAGECVRLDAASTAAGYVPAALVRDATRNAAVALVVRDSITPDQFDSLHGPWSSAIK